MKQRVAIHVTGLVQGVGFRWFASNSATKHELAGFVKNQMDGSVYIEAEGEEDNLKQYLEEIRRGPQFSSVKDLKINWQAYENRFSSFEIKY